jgi:hypothetical protein
VIIDLGGKKKKLKIFKVINVEKSKENLDFV